MSGSRSFINLCTALTLSRFLAETIAQHCPEDDPGCRKIRRLAARVIPHVMATRDLWPDCSREEVGRVEANVARLGSAILQGDRSMEELCGVTLALLVDMEPFLKGKRRRSIEELREFMEAMNREFDRRGENHSAYEYASEAVEQWYESLDL
jgi:hypothetical protein